MKLLLLTIGLLGLAFAYHTYGMGLRWHLSGHAPWSNGYESMIYISFLFIYYQYIYFYYNLNCMYAAYLEL